MRAHHIIAVEAALLVGVILKLIFFTTPTAGANALPSKRVSVDVFQLQQNVKSLPVAARLAEVRM